VVLRNYLRHKVQTSEALSGWTGLSARVLRVLGGLSVLSNLRLNCDKQGRRTIISLLGSRG
jgi:hypothetical protein